MQGGQRQQQRKGVGPQAGLANTATDAAPPGPGSGGPGAPGGAPPQTGAYALPFPPQPALAAAPPPGLWPGVQPQWPLQWQPPAAAAGAAPVSFTARPLSGPPKDHSFACAHDLHCANLTHPHLATPGPAAAHRPRGHGGKAGRRTREESPGAAALPGAPPAAPAAGGGAVRGGTAGD